jgi:Tfp pilus assembly protein PilN
MIRINLLPPEIMVARRDEHRWKWVWLAGGLMAVVVAIVWGIVFLQVASSRADVASIQQQAAMLRAQTTRFDVFQRKEDTLRVRKDAVAAATAGRIDWARMLFELGLVLPDDIYLTVFTGSDGA